MKRKIVLLGGGSHYFEQVIGELATTPELAGCSAVLYDVDPKRMGLVRRAGQRIIQAVGAKLKLTATTDLARALDGADFAIASIGVHGPGQRWHKADVEAVARLGTVHTTGDTVGPAGISQGLRIIPIFVAIARQMTRYCPDVVLLNHSNPMDPICRAVIKAAGIQTIGYCHNVAHETQWFAKVLGVPPAELEVTAAGPNHILWLLDIRHQGRSVYPELKRRILALPPEPTRTFAREVLALLGLYPIAGDRHMVEFFPHARVATKPEELLYGMQWRADMIRQGALARELSKEPSALELRARGKLPPAVPTGVSPESMGEQIRSLALGIEKLHYVNTPNRGAVPNLPDWAVIELKAVISSRGATPLFVGELPPQAARWTVAQVYAQELLVDAAIEGSREKALQALACDPMVLSFREPAPLLDALVAAQGPRLRQFRKGTR
jgi:alpha-galactosidase